jgi:hypothetical protein
MSGKHLIRNAERERYLGIGMAIGLPIFGLLGIALCLATDTPGLLGVGPAIGLAMGIAIGEGLYQRRRQSKGNEK